MNVGPGSILHVASVPGLSTVEGVAYAVTAQVDWMRGKVQCGK